MGCQQCLLRKGKLLLGNSMVCFFCSFSPLVVCLGSPIPGFGIGSAGKTSTNFGQIQFEKLD